MTHIVITASSLNLETMLHFFDDNEFHTLCEDAETLTSDMKTVKERDKEYLKKGMIWLPK